VKVTVKTPARLHLGLIDMNGDLGRMFGGLGVGINKPNVVLEAENADHFSVTGQETALVSALAHKFFTAYPVKPKVHLHVVEAIPSHVGLGSGTQLSLAVATALSRVLNVKASTAELALAMGRARRTAVGTTIFQKGGFVVDGGKNLKGDSFPPLLYRQPFPDEWRLVVAVPNQKEGLSNSEENHAFQKLAKQSSQDAAEICHLIMLKLLPAIAEKDIDTFGDALTKIQILTGNFFAQAQGGTYSSLVAAQCIEFMKGAGAYGVGQSSWGPALYAVVKQEQAKQVQKKIKVYLNRGVGGEVFIAKANNKGAIIKKVED
jgi:beta-ribofuranosylaminobenzene 5'-phosphate synthase